MSTNSLNTKPKRLWRYVNDQRIESGLLSTMTDGSIVADSTTDIANLLRTQFRNVFNNQHLSPQAVADATANVFRISASLQQFSITDNMVIAAGKYLKPSMGSGQDGVPALILFGFIGSTFGNSAEQVADFQCVPGMLETRFPARCD